MNSRVKLWLAPLVLMAIVSSAWILFIKPSLEKFAKDLILEQNHSLQNVRIDLQELHFDLIPPRVAIEQFQLAPQKELQEVFSPIFVRQGLAELNPFKLLIGKLEVNLIKLQGLDVEVQLDPLLNSPTPSKPLPTDLIFSTLKKFPIRNLEVKDLALRLYSTQHDFSVSSQQTQIALNYNLEQISVELEAEKIIAGVLGKNAELRFRSEATLTENEIQLSDYEIKNESLSLSGRGQIPQWKNLPVKPKVDLQLELNTELAWLDEFIMHFAKIDSLLLHGQVAVQGRFILDDKKLLVDSKANYKDLHVLNMPMGSGAGNLKGDLQRLDFSAWALQHPAGSADVSEFQLSLSKDLSFKGKVQVANLDLQKLLVTLDLKNIPTWMDLRGELNCTGQFTSPYNSQCAADISAKDIKVSAGMEAKDQKIAEIPELAAIGTVKINNKSVDYDAKLTARQDRGESKGSISYKDGFSISFKTPSLNIENISYLVGLQMKGSAAIEGLTSGDSNAATFNMFLNTKDFILEGFQLGSTTTQLSYEKGQLKFDEILGAFKKTQYLGQLEVDVNQSQIKGRISSPLAASEDIFEILSNLFEMPVSVTSFGKAEMDFSGPFDFWQLNFKLKGAFNEVFIAGDRFDSFFLDVEAKNGIMSIDRAQLRRNRSDINATGKIGPQQNLNIEIKTDNLKIEESTKVGKLNSNLFGTVIANASLRGTPQSPKMNLNAKIVNSVFGDQELPDSTLDLKLDNQKMDLNFDLLGKRIFGSILYPFNNQSSPLAIKITSKEWKFGHALSFLTGSSITSDFDTSITGTLDLQSPSGALFKSSGSLDIQKLMIQKTGQRLQNPKPIQIQFDQGLATLQNFKLAGDQNEINITGRQFTADRLDIKINAETDLKFFHILLPFLDDINGQSEVAASIRGNLSQPEIFGSAQFNNVFIRLKGFPHPFEKIRADVSFSQNRVLINSVRGQLAGGNLQGDGTINFLGLKDFPTSVRIKVDGVSLNVPEKVKTQGSGDLVFSGKWFPFVLSGTYRIQNATIEKEFTEGSTTTGGIRQSIYLPKVLREETFEPIALDLQVISEKPLYVKNSLVDGYARGNLQVKGTPTNPILLGKVGIEKNTKIIIKDKIFEIQAGNVLFSNPQEVNPDLFITAQSRISEYDVNVLVQGGAKNPNIRLSSIPPLSEQDIISLLALGVTSSQMDQNIQSRDQQNQTGYEIGAAIISNNAPIRDLQERLGVNLQFTSSYDSARNISVPKVTFSKKVNERINASASRTLGDQATVDVKLQLQLTNTFSAIGTWEDREVTQGTDNLSDNSTKQNQSVFGLDLEYKKEFK